MSYLCNRCGGTGRFSFNLIHGDKCYGCMGTGRQKTKPKDPHPLWAVFGQRRDDPAFIRLYNVRAKTEAGAIQQARNTYSKASTAFKDQHTLYCAKAMKVIDMADQSAIEWDAARRKEPI